MSENKTTRNYVEMLIQENLEQTKTIDRQKQEIEELRNSIAVVSEKIPVHFQKIDELEDSFAMFSNQVEDKFENLPKHQPRPIMPFMMIGVGLIGFILAMGLNLEGQFGQSKFSYKGEGVTSAIVQIVLSALGGGAIAKNIDPIKEFFDKD